MSVPKTAIKFQIYPKDSKNICILNAPEALTSNGFAHSNDGTAYDTYCRDIGRQVGNIYNNEGNISYKTILNLQDRMEKQILPYLRKLGKTCEEFFRPLNESQITEMFEKQCKKHVYTDSDCVKSHLSQKIYEVSAELVGCLEKYKKHIFNDTIELTGILEKDNTYHDDL